MLVEPVEAVAARSVMISLTATVLALTWSIPIAFHLSRPGAVRGLTLVVMESLVGVPTVLVGLLLYMLLSRRGPLGFLDMLYTPQAIVLGEAILITPLLVSVSYRSLSGHIGYVREALESLGARGARLLVMVAREALPGLVGSASMGFSRAVGELGVALIVGGNIAGYTRTLSTSIALATSMGLYGYAVKLGIVLLALSLGVGLLGRLTVYWLEQRWS